MLLQKLEPKNQVDDQDGIQALHMDTWTKPAKNKFE